jgi:hypothetical protein
MLDAGNWKLDAGCCGKAINYETNFSEGLLYSESLSCFQPSFFWVNIGLLLVSAALQVKPYCFFYPEGISL